MSPRGDIEGVGDMLFFDKNINIKFGMKRTGKINGIIVYTTHKKFLFEAHTRKEFFEF